MFSKGRTFLMHVNGGENNRRRWGEARDTMQQGHLSLTLSDVPTSHKRLCPK